MPCPVDAMNLRDPSSSTNLSWYRTEHLKFDWTVDFTESVISGSTCLTVTKLRQEDCPPLLLDVNDLDIQTVRIRNGPVQWKITPNPTPALGSTLEVQVPPNETKFEVEVVYKTSPNSSALQWLEPAQTRDGRLPFMYSQCQAIHARSMFPCQDTPSIKSTFDAVVHVPSDIVVVMGALRTSVSYHGDNGNEYHFSQKVPIPSYLVAIACGDLVSEPVGPRSAVWAERSFVKKAAAEFCETEKMISAGEELCGPYIWGRYDILVLPPAFPYGGMENPCLTFVSPTIVSGDRSLVNVIAHEIAHSWTGNLVTNSSWEHFWINEGHTVYLERLIMGKLLGSETRHLLLAIGYAELITACNELGPDSPFSKLVLNLDGVDPDVAYSRIPYEKGSLLLFFLEQKFGRDKMMQWLKAYVRHFGSGALDTDTWREFLATILGPDVNSPSVDWNNWLFGYGLPSWKPVFGASEMISQCEELNDLLSSPKLSQDASQTGAVASLWAQLSSIQRELSLRRLNARPALPTENIRTIDALLGLSRQQNAELRFEWSILCIRAQFLPALESCLEFLNSQGRMRYTRPLYRELMKWPEVRSQVLDNFRTNRPHMHRTTSTLVERDVGLA